MKTLSIIFLLSATALPASAQMTVSTEILEEPAWTFQLAVSNVGSDPIEVPSAYDGESVVLYAQGPEHGWPLNMWVDAAGNSAPTVTLLPGETHVIVEVSLQLLLSSNWTWMAHPAPPTSPMRVRSNSGELVTSLTLWATVDTASGLVESSRVTVDQDGLLECYSLDGTEPSSSDQ